MRIIRKPRWLTRRNVAIFAAFAGLGNAVVGIASTWVSNLHYSQWDMTAMWVAIILWIITASVYMFRGWKFERLFNDSMRVNEQQRTFLRKVTGR